MKLRLSLLGLLAAGSLARGAPSVAQEEWARAAYRFTPAVESAFLAQAKSDALARLAAAGVTLPDDFLAWIDSDPVVRTTVYGARKDPTGILRWLRSLEIDLGPEVVRKDYTQFALAMAVVCAPDTAGANLAPRPRLTLAIGGDPRQPVDTHAKDRPLDLNDHIINFLQDHTLEEDVVVGQKEEPPELKYDDKGVAIPAPKRAKPKMVPVTEKRTRSLYAADVIASPDLQRQFNEYLAGKGFTNRVDCGDHVVHWKSHDMVQGAQKARIAAAFTLFRAAYEAKGLLPAQRDPAATPAERCAYLIRNDRFRFPADQREARKWPRYPLNAPWPTLTLLAQDAQPLREREERWIAFRDRGEVKTYGEYIGGIAQQYDMQSARRVKDFPYQYGSIQMMLKDGGVCGTMAGISVRTHGVLGVPASTAGQPGHCALVLFGYDPKTDTYGCRGSQYATAGDAGTGVHGKWVFGDTDARRPMIYHQSVAWSVNYGLQAYLDSCAAHTFYRQLAEPERAAHGPALLQSAWAASPYNFLLADAAIAAESDPARLADLWSALSPALASGRAGCPSNGLYHTTVKEHLFARVAALPVPVASGVAAGVLDFLRKEGCVNQAALIGYRVAVAGATSVLASVESSFRAHVASARTDESVAAMADQLAAAAKFTGDAKARKEWAQARWAELQGHEKYAGRKGAITTDRCVGVLAKLAGRRPRGEVEQLASYLDELAANFRRDLNGARTAQGCKAWSGTISATAKQLKSAEQAKAWLESLAAMLAGREEYPVTVRGRERAQRDPCADTIRQLLAPPAPAST